MQIKDILIFILMNPIAILAMLLIGALHLFS
jgi:hypothetical protein